MLVSQFTLLGRTSNGRRPSFDDAAPSDEAKRLYEQVAVGLRDQGTHVETGVFAAHMQVELLNDGPVTFVLDSRGAGSERLPDVGSAGQMGGRRVRSRHFHHRLLY